MERDPQEILLTHNHCSTCYAHTGLVERVESVKEDTTEIKEIVKELRKEHKDMYIKIAALTAAVAFIAGYLGINLGEVLL
jgi:preprotein translocase subunit Sss1